MADVKVKYALVDPETGEATCLGCGTKIVFLPPDHIPDAGPNTLNHTACPGAGPTSSPAGAHLSADGQVQYETINPIDRATVEAYYDRQRKKGKTILTEAQRNGLEPLPTK
jgi:hypothetical protein